MKRTLSLTIFAILLTGMVPIFAEQANYHTSDGSSTLPEYRSVVIINDSQIFSEEVTSSEINENAILINGGTARISNAVVARSSKEGTEKDLSELYGVGACILTIDGSANIADCAINSSTEGATGVFAYGNSEVSLSCTTITTEADYAEALHTTNANLTATNLTVSTSGESSAAIHCSSGSTIIDGGTYSTYGINSPAIRCVGVLTLNDAVLTANNSEAVCLDGEGIVRLNNCILTGTMQDIPLDRSTRTVLLNRSASANASQPGCVFEMSGGSLNSENGGVFYTTGTDSIITLENVSILENDDCEFLLRCDNNPNDEEKDIPGTKCIFTAIRQTLKGNTIYDNSSEVDIYITNGSNYSGMITPENMEHTDGSVCNLYIDGSSVWIVTDNSYVTALSCEGIIADASGNTVTIVDPEGNPLAEGNSPYTITVERYLNTCDTTGAQRIDRY